MILPNEVSHFFVSPIRLQISGIILFFPCLTSRLCCWDVLLRLDMWGAFSVQNRSKTGRLIEAPKKYRIHNDVEWHVARFCATGETAQGTCVNDVTHKLVTADIKRTLAGWSVVVEISWKKCLMPIFLNTLSLEIQVSRILCWEIVFLFSWVAWKWFRKKINEWPSGVWHRPSFV